MISLYYENINYVMTQILKLSCVSFSYVNISYVLALFYYRYLFSCRSKITYSSLSFAIFSLTAFRPFICGLSDFCVS